MAKVSVIVPVYNVEKYLDRCLTTLLNQTLDDIEFIVVNDGSTDSSEEIIKKYQAKCDKIKYHKKENGGLSDARNFGMKYATGDYIAFLDSDDFVDKTIYEKMYNKAIEESADYVECDFYWAYPKLEEKNGTIISNYLNEKNNINITPNENNEINKIKNENKEINKYNNESKKENNSKFEELIQSEIKNLKLKKDIGFKYQNKKEMLTYGRVVAWNKLIKKEIIKEEFPKGLNYEDVEFFYKLIPNVNKFAFVEEPLIYYVQRENSIVNKQSYKNGQIFNVFDNVFDYYKKNDLYDEYFEELEYTYTRILLCSSFKRIKQIKDEVQREKLLYETWQNINTKFPDWKSNKILKTKSLKNLYMRSVNEFTYKIYSKL